MAKVLLSPIPEHPYLCMENFNYDKPVDGVIEGGLVLVSYDELVKGGADEKYLSKNTKGYPFSIFTLV